MRRIVRNKVVQVHDLSWRRSWTCATLLFLLAGGYVWAQQPADLIGQRIAAARQQIAKNGDAADGYNELAQALTRRFRESGDRKFLGEAEQAIAQALRLSPDNFDACKNRVIVRLAQKRYAEALAEAKALNKRIPDDNAIYGLIADADIALGGYADAEQAAQRMIDMRRVNAPGLQRGAELRVIFGYNAPALEWWISALRITSETDREERAWVLTRMAPVSLAMGKADDAASELRQALELVPDYPWALTELARTRMAQDKAAEAVELLRKRIAKSPDVPSLFELAAALDKAGKGAEAKSAYADFEAKALAAADQSENANRELMMFYSGPGNRPAEAVRIGRMANAQRQDVYTMDAYAWALYRNGSVEEARAAIDSALKPGIKNAEFFYHAGMIAARRNDSAAALKYLKESLSVNANSPDSGAVIDALAELSKTAKPKS